MIAAVLLVGVFLWLAFKIEDRIDAMDRKRGLD